MTKRLFLDLDGTLIDPRLRLYNLFCELAPESVFSFEEYWQYKRNNVSQRQLLQDHIQYTETQIATFKEAWMAQVEEPERLALDVPFEGVQGFLAQASLKFDLFVVTGRQHHDHLLQQIQRMGLSHYFSGIFNTGQKQSKAELIRTCTEWCSDDILVGDTGEDILAGKELGVRTVAVTSGALNEIVLRKYHPDAVLESVIQLEI